MSHCSWNINQLLHSRELLPLRKKLEIENTLEQSFAQGNYTYDDVTLPDNVSSTIAIAVSCDGLTFATTHGDHSVKIFRFYVNTPYRVFTGHPRTPWTVKYHPSDPNILASGCLGFQIRVWDIENNTCLNINRLDYSIISLSFHPNGEYIAVATGIKLEVWNWKEGLKQTSNYADQHIVQNHIVEHTRNIRAVLFFPSGDYLLAAAPNDPKPPGESLTYCNLYAIPLRRIRPRKDLDELPDSLALTSFPVILHQIHLYSDGGFDVSKDGNYFVTCARLSEHRNKFNASNSTSFSPLSTSITDRVAEEERQQQQLAAHQHMMNNKRNPPPVVVRPSFLSSFVPPVFNNNGVNNNNRNNKMKRTYLEEEVDLTQDEPMDLVPLPPAAPEITNKSSKMKGTISQPIPPFHHRRDEVLSREAPPPPPVPISFPFSSRPTSSSGATTSSSNSLNANTNINAITTASAVAAISAHQQLLSLAQKRRAQLQPERTPANFTFDQFLSPQKGGPLKNSSTPGKNNNSTMDVSTSSVNTSMDELDQSYSASASKAFRGDPYFLFKSALRSPFNRDPHQRRKLNVTVSAETFAPGVKFQDYVCLFKMDVVRSEHDPDETMLTPSLINCHQLNGSLVKAITSTKISPTNRFMLVGYGVRSKNGVVEDHAYGHVSCELLNLLDPYMKKETLFCDKDDEVNIAQFHPLPGHGLLYGTKRGKIRTYLRENQLKINDDELEEMNIVEAGEL